MLTEFNEDRAKKVEIFRMIRNSKAFEQNKVQIYSLEGKSFKDGSTGNVIHFCFADGHMFRRETDVDLRKAICNFHDPKTVKKLKENFNTGVSFVGTKEIDLTAIF